MKKGRQDKEKNKKIWVKEGRGMREGRRITKRQRDKEDLDLQ